MLRRRPGSEVGHAEGLSLGLVTMVRRDLSGKGPDAAPAADAPRARDWEPASLLSRFGALMLDWIGCLLITGTFASARAEPWVPVVLLIAEYGFFIGVFGQTPGMWVTRIRCVSVDDQRPVGIPRALLRGVLLALFVPALIMDGDRRGVHDRYANTAVMTGRPQLSQR
jgi:uncharacterized RDD family membrane protein YckC